MLLLKQLVFKIRYIVLYGAALGVLVFALKWLQWKFLLVDHSTQLYTGLVALFFTVLGSWIASQLFRTRVKTVVVEKEVPVFASPTLVPDETLIRELGLTTREYEVLQRMARGMSNAEIAENLFLSLSTVKTHASNLFVKLDVKSRTKAAEKGKRLGIIV